MADNDIGTIASSNQYPAPTFPLLHTENPNHCRQSDNSENHRVALLWVMARSWSVHYQRALIRLML
ncbi:MAG: hypothetical protein V7L23_18590 [Nostoc sp.]|uniref:hypothetical protein n=1 Tax=Nostoc sp. TaxID=1180 RepID=UPI002FF031FF